MKKSCFILTMAIALNVCGASEAASPFHAGAATQRVETVTANLAMTSNVVANNFVGVSLEAYDVVNYSILGSTSLLNLMKLLGPCGFMRIGADAQDSNPAPPLTQTIANTIASFASSLGSCWSVDYGLDGEINNSSLAATQAGYMATAFSGVSNALTLNFGNEPEGWSGFTESSFQTTWNNYYTAVKAVYPSVQLEAPDVYTASIIESYVNGLTPGASGLSYVSYHGYYITNAFGPSNPSVQQIIADSQSAKLNAISPFPYSTYVSYSGGNFRINEGGIQAIGPTPNVPNELVASSWYLNMVMGMANAGVLGFNLHSVISEYEADYQGQPYPVVWNLFLEQSDHGYAATAIFNGMVLFSKMQGQTIVTTSQSGNGTVTSFATLASTGKANILVVNDDTANAVAIMPSQSAAWSTASVLTIAASGAGGCSNTNPVIGGAPIGEGGSWSGSPFTIQNGQHFTLGPCESALVTITS